MEGSHWLGTALAWRLYTSLLLSPQPNSKDHALGFNRTMHTVLGAKDGSRDSTAVIKADTMALEGLTSNQRPRLFLGLLTAVTRNIILTSA